MNIVYYVAYVVCYERIYFKQVCCEHDLLWTGLFRKETILICFKKFFWAQENLGKHKNLGSLAPNGLPSYKHASFPEVSLSPQVSYIAINHHGRFQVA